MMQRGARLTLDVEKPAAGGRMLARHAGQIVLVAGTIPGERITARVERAGKGVVFADVEEVLTASPDRRTGTPDPRCGGTVFSHIAYPRQCRLKAQIIQDAFARIARLPLAVVPDVLGSPEAGYRMRARLHVQGHRIGFFREGTHELCDAAMTSQLLPGTVEWIAAASEVLRAIGTAAGRAGVASLEIAENVAGDRRAVHLELHEGVAPEPYRPLAIGLVGLSAQAADARRPTVLAGTPSIADDLRAADGRLTLTRDVRAFFQGNRFLLQPLVDRVVSLAGSGPVVDLYAGAGLFGLSVAAAGSPAVTLVEGDPISGADLSRNAAALGDRVRVHRQSVETFLEAGGPGARRERAPIDAVVEGGRVMPRAPRHPDIPAAATFIVDPPRTGMTREALAGIVAHAPARIVYVSCDVATLARDARALVEAGWGLTEVTGIDLFPNTAHVESIAVLERGR